MHRASAPKRRADVGTKTSAVAGVAAHAETGGRILTDEGTGLGSGIGTGAGTGAGVDVGPRVGSGEGADGGR